MRYVSKQFFTEHAHETGNIVVTVETPHPDDIYAYQIKKGSDMMTASVKISDCHDSAVIDFDCRKKGDFEKRLQKLDKWIDELQKMRHHMVEFNRLQAGEIASRKLQLELEEGEVFDAA
jgi:hypothetical protein